MTFLARLTLFGSAALLLAPPAGVELFPELDLMFVIFGWDF